MEFYNLGIRKEIGNNLKKNGIKEPTEVQKEVIVEMLNNKELIVKSPTGTGKTFAYLLPIVETLLSGENGINIIMVPTRELVIQIVNELKIIDVYKNLKYKGVYGGREIIKNKGEFENLQIIIGTPTRILDYIKKGFIKYNITNRVVIDEADVMLDMGFKQEIDEVVKLLPKKKKLFFFSATISKEVKKIAYRYQEDPRVIEIDYQEEELNIKEVIVKTTDRRKIDILCEMLNEDKPFIGLIFCRTKARVEKLEELLSERGYSCEKIHSDIPQRKREKIMENVRNLEVQFLVATDILARGIDIVGVTHIYSYDAPETMETYIHRKGRTGRNGLNGESYLILTERDSNFLSYLESQKGINLEIRDVVYEPGIQSTIEFLTGKYRKKVSPSSKKIKEIQIIKERARIKKDRD